MGNNNTVCDTFMYYWWFQFTQLVGRQTGIASLENCFVVSNKKLALVRACTESLSLSLNLLVNGGLPLIGWGFHILFYILMHCFYKDVIYF